MRQMADTSEVQYAQSIRGAALRLEQDYDGAHRNNVPPTMLPAG